jgi:rare lipoprotein A
MMRQNSTRSGVTFPRPSRWRRSLTVTAGLLLGVGLTVAGVRLSRNAPAVLVQERARAGTWAGQLAARHGWHQVGLASWYGPEFQGKETAGGEPYNENDLTCAHRFLPLGTWVKITNLHTHRWVVVRVNDRGPVPDTRIADLSAQAARMLGMRNRGVTQVRIDVIDPQVAAEAARRERILADRAALEADSIVPGD